MSTCTTEPAPAPEKDLGSLPQWDLSDLYEGPQSPELARDLAMARATAKTFQERYAGKLQALDGEALGAAITEYERLKETLDRIASYAHLLFSVAMDDGEVGRFFQTTREEINDIATHTLFFTLELNRLDDAALDGKMTAPALARYAPWLRDLRAFRPYQLSDEAERLLHEKTVTGRGAWTRLFDETVAALRFGVDGRSLTSAQALDLLSSPDPGVRRAAATALGQVFAENARTFALILNTLIKDKAIEDRWRGFPRPISSRNLMNHVEDEVVDALAQAVSQAQPRLAHRYYTIKARWFGVDALDYWDRNAPLPEDDDRVVPWDEARDVVLNAYAGFSPGLADTARRFFDHPWIDARVKPGKAPGAFAHPTVPSAHPYLLLNYQGKMRDVMTLAHELGHGVHQILAAEQGPLMAETPLTLAETASVFGEQLTFRALLASEPDPRRRRVLIAGKVEDMLNTVVRQIAFLEFERRLHDERREGELTPERIGAIWLAVQGQSLGPGIRLSEAYRHYWAYIPHFVHSPFYVYAYAFGDCLVNALYALYREGVPKFEAKYLDMLRAGGTRRHRELLTPFGLNPSDPKFWSKGLGVMAELIDELDMAV
ncbi:MAG: M3 family oligoendopeptidase [Alphaproteobacteria bacterium]